MKYLPIHFSKCLVLLLVFGFFQSNLVQANPGDEASKQFAQKVLDLALADAAAIQEEVLFAEAVQILKKPTYLNEVALQALNQGFYDQAKTVFRINQTLFPKTKALGDVLLAIAALDQTQSIRQLEQLFNQCYQCMPSSEYLHSFGSQLLNFKEPQKALAAFQLNTMLFPEEAKVWSAYATGLLVNQELDKAAFYYQKVQAMQASEELSNYANKQLALIERLSSEKMINRELISPNTTVKLIGKINKEAFQLADYQAWFEEGYQAYEADQAALQTLKAQNKDNIEIKAFFGSWCGDSRREIPRFYKVAEAAGFSEKQLQVFAVNNELKAYKQSDGREEKDLAVFRVPTFVVYQNGEEIGRIIESPIESFETDLTKIITQQAYSPNYAGVMAFDQLLSQKGARYIRKNTEKIAESFKNQVTKASELYSYALTKYAANQPELAISILKINEVLYPEYIGNPLRLGQIYADMGKSEEAIPLLKAYLKERPQSASIRVLIWKLEQEKL